MLAAEAPFGTAAGVARVLLGSGASALVHDLRGVTALARAVERGGSCTLNRELQDELRRATYKELELRIPL
jgi:hypothetical protein